jgi:hypothetical protein
MCTERVWWEVGVCVDAFWRAVLQVYGVVRGRVDSSCQLYRSYIVADSCRRAEAGDDASTVM